MKYHERIVLILWYLWTRLETWKRTETAISWAEHTYTNQRVKGASLWSAELPDEDSIRQTRNLQSQTLHTLCTGLKIKLALVEKHCPPPSYHDDLFRILSQNVFTSRCISVDYTRHQNVVLFQLDSYYRLITHSNVYIFVHFDDFSLEDMKTQNVTQWIWIWQTIKILCYGLRNHGEDRWISWAADRVLS